MNPQVKKLLNDSGMVIIFIVVFALASIFVPQFLTVKNMSNLGLAVATVAMVSCTMLFCLAAGDFDLSVGSNLALGGMVAVLVSNMTGSLLYGILAAVVIGSLVGLVNGVVIAKFGINALITTLATMQIVRGAVNLLCGGQVKSPILPSFGALGEGQNPIWFAIACFIIFGVLLNYTLFGRNTLAIGGNIDAARLAGIKVVGTKIWIFVLSGAVAALAGVISASRLVAASNAAGEKLELQAISACVLGGVSLSGGVGSISGVAVGVLIMGIVENVMRLLQVNTFWQMIVTGAILLAAVLIDRFKTKNAKA